MLRLSDCIKVKYR